MHKGDQMDDDSEIRNKILTLNIDRYGMPIRCEKCGGVMVFQGCGEYKCEKCGHMMYDDYGKVRNFLDGHAGASAAQVSDATGVSQKSIRMMLRDSRIEVTAGTQSFFYCEMCGKPIRSGEYCSECEAKIHRQIENSSRDSRAPKDIHGFTSSHTPDADGEWRFNKNK